MALRRSVLRHAAPRRRLYYDPDNYHRSPWSTQADQIGKTVFVTKVHPRKDRAWAPLIQTSPHPSESKYLWEPEVAPTEAQLAAAPKVVTVFGGRGFLGSHVVRRLAEDPAVERVRVATRFPEEVERGLPSEWRGKVTAEFVNPTDRHNVLVACDGSQGLVNALGISYECELTFHEAHVQFPAFVAHAANVVWASRVVHVSSLASSLSSPSVYGDSKFRGEDVARANYPNATILRPGPMFGRGAATLRRFLQAARRLPVYPCVRPDFALQPVWVEDVADAVVRCLRDPATRANEYDLGGPQLYTHSELVRKVLSRAGVSRPVIPIPTEVGMALGAAAHWLPDPVATKDTVRLLKYQHWGLANHDDAHTFAELGITPKSLDEVKELY